MPKAAPAASPAPKKPHGLCGRTGKKNNAFIPPADRRSLVVSTRCTPGEQKAIAAAARAAGQSVGDWVRATLTSAL